MLTTGSMRPKRVALLTSNSTVLTPRNSLMTKGPTNFGKNFGCSPRCLRESVLFIGTQFSILYTSMYSPAEAATRSCHEAFYLFLQKQKIALRSRIPFGYLLRWSRDTITNGNLRYKGCHP